MLTFIVNDSGEASEIIRKCCSSLGFSSYTILDPKSNTIPKKIYYVLEVGETGLKPASYFAKIKGQVISPTLSMTPENKRTFFDQLKENVDRYRMMAENDTVKKGDLPPLKTLKEMLNEMYGQVVEVRLPDRRKVGIYPDSEKKKGLYDLEYHASYVYNMALISELFGANELIIKDL